MYMTQRDNDILDSLVFNVNLFSFKQITTFFWGDSKASKCSARKRLTELVSNKYLCKEQVLALNTFPLKNPLYEWSPGQPWPEYERLSEVLNYRWTLESPCITTVYFASKKAVNCLGGPYSLFNRARASQNLNVSQLYFNLYKEQMLFKWKWIGEANLAETSEEGDRIPDAILKKENESDIAIRLVSKLSVDRLESLHEYHVKKGMRYQLW